MKCVACWHRSDSRRQPKSGVHAAPRRACRLIRCKHQWASSRVSQCSVRMADSPRRQRAAVPVAPVAGAVRPAVSVVAPVAVMQAMAAAQAVTAHAAVTAAGKQTVIVQAAKRTATAQCRVRAAPLAVRAAVVRRARLPWAMATGRADARQTAAASALVRAAVKARLARVHKVMAAPAAQAVAARARRRATARADAKDQTSRRSNSWMLDGARHIAETD